jgi:hypothetical protein
MDLRARMYRSPSRSPIAEHLLLGLDHVVTSGKRHRSRTCMHQRSPGLPTLIRFWHLFRLRDTGTRLCEVLLVRSVSCTYQFTFVVCLIILSNFGDDNGGSVIMEASDRFEKERWKGRWLPSSFANWTILNQHMLKVEAA